MAERAISCMKFLELLTTTYRMTARLSRTLLADATREQVLCISEVVLNTLEGNVEVPSSVLRQLSRGKRVLRKVTRIVRGTDDRLTSSIKISVASRRQLKQVYVTHYKTLVEFLEHCLPHLKKLLSTLDDSDNEI